MMARAAESSVTMILKPGEMKAVEERAFAEGVSAEYLMEDAGAQIAAAVSQFTPRAGVCVVFFGKGHNGGDALVAARRLAASGWRIHLTPVFNPTEWAELTRKKFDEVKAWDSGPFIRRTPSLRALPFVVLDGVLGLGAKGPLRDPIDARAREINWLRVQGDARVFGLDGPTGLDLETGAADPNCVVADFTLAIGFAKTGMLADAATRFVGRLAVLPLEELSTRRPGASPAVTVAGAVDLAPLLPPRRFDIHKGDCGRVAIVAGSRGFTGAAVMCAEAAVRAGAGLVSLYTTPDVVPLIASRIMPEVMVHAVTSLTEVDAGRHDAVAVGPGLGTARSDEVLRLIRAMICPVVVDADALNILATSIDTLRTCAGERLLTPHPGEMARLAPDTQYLQRREIVRTFTDRYPVTLLLKGARTIVGQLGFRFSYNSTGTPGMATGGMGDVLTGVCVALAAQHLNLYVAARLGAWLCGRAAERAVCHGGESEESLTPSALLAHLGGAFKDLHASGY